MNTTEPKYKRQRYLLSFIRQLEDGISTTDLQKLVFLSSQYEGLDYYKFIPYLYGSYSFQLAEDLEILQRDGHVQIGDQGISATGKYSKVKAFQIPIERRKKLLTKAYREFPYYTIHSEILSQLFYGEELEKFYEQRIRYHNSEQVLFTMGYEGKCIEDFFNIMLQNNVRVLCDVRKNPLSRKFMFSKSSLEHICSKLNIAYVHIPELGIDSKKRTSLETADDYKSLFSDYEKTLHGLTKYFEQIYTLLQTNVRITLMCFEQDPLMCHRNIIKNYLVQTYKIKSDDI